MLTARKVPRACQSCRSQLLSLFEYGFTKPTASAASSHSRYRDLRYRSIQPRPNNLRLFSTTLTRSDDSQTNTSTAESDELAAVAAAAAAAETESVVRQARQTFGETLPKDYLSAQEYQLYERLYGPPLRETRPDDLEYLQVEEEDIGEDGPSRNVLLRENADGEFEEIEFDPELGFKVVEDASDGFASASEGEGLGFEEEGEPDTELKVEELSMGTETHAEADAPSITFQAQNQREADAIARLQRDMDEAMARAAEQEDTVFDEDYEEEESSGESEEELFEDEEIEEDDYDAYTNSDEIRTHPHTRTSRFGTSPSTISLPKEQFVTPITELLERTSIKHVTEAAHKAFGGKWLPYSSSTPNVGKLKLLPQKHIGLDASQHRMSEIEADAYLAGVMSGTYTSVMSTLVEVRKRLGSEWIREMLFREGGQGPRILDAGAGGAGIVAWREIVRAEWDVLKDDGIVEGDEPPSGKYTVLTGADALRHRVSRFLENTTFLPRLPDYVHSSNGQAQLDGGPAQPRKIYDVIIAPHTLFPLKEDYRRKHMVQNLWSMLDPEGGVLILIEKGLPRGFEAIAGARSLLLDSHISSPGDENIEKELQSLSENEPQFVEKEQGMIIAPCTNHTKCPMYPVPGLTPGRKDFCHFEQRYIRPPYLQKILGASSRNHEDVRYSYIAVRRGIDGRKEEDILQGDAATDQSFAGYEEHNLPDGPEIPDEGDVPFHPLSLPRSMLPPLKRRGHVTLDVCTPSGKLERWTIPKSFSKAAYRDARKSKWGDLWALGAKTRVLRQPRLGRGGEGVVNSKGSKPGKVLSKSAAKKKKNKFDIIMGREGMEGIEESRDSKRIFKPEKRTKGGRFVKPKKPITEDDI
ncbi:37S ribosomal protein S22 [Ciborinia camelliae]|nr:37S ribosomal protein S22 [Ciborinia camelliae]